MFYSYFNTNRFIEILNMMLLNRVVEDDKLSIETVRSFLRCLIDQCLLWISSSKTRR